MLTPLHSQSSLPPSRWHSRCKWTRPWLVRRRFVDVPLIRSCRNSCIWTSILLGILYMSFSAWGIVYGAHGFVSFSLRGSLGQCPDGRPLECRRSHDLSLTLADPRSRTPYQNVQMKGLSFLGLGLGIVLGALSHPIWAHYYAKVTKETGKRPPPEEHLRKGMVGVVICPVALFWFAFTTYESVHWAVSEVASVFFGFVSHSRWADSLDARRAAC